MVLSVGEASLGDERKGLVTFASLTKPAAELPKELNSF